ncbi:MAG: sulfite exporter TauE/SafE family protein [Bacilli bacterium]
MEIGLVILLFAIGYFGSFLSGMLGVGGSIIKYPMLLYIPALFGFIAYDAHTVSGISAVQVFFSTIGGVWAYRKSEYLHRGLIVTMGTAILIGSLLGGYGSVLLSATTVNVVYAILATIATVLMFIPTKENSQTTSYQLQNKGLAFVLAFIVGAASGVVGAAGAFLLVPIMLVILKVPMRLTVATSLAITLISSIGTTFSKIATGQVEYMPALIMVVASLLAAPLGAKVSQSMNVNVLRSLLSLLILATAVKIWMDIL